MLRAEILEAGVLRHDPCQHIPETTEDDVHVFAHLGFLLSTSGGATKLFSPSFTVAGAKHSSFSALTLVRPPPGVKRSDISLRQARDGPMPPTGRGASSLARQAKVKVHFIK
jgi:hypothetical protein